MVERIRRTRAAPPEEAPLRVRRSRPAPVADIPVPIDGLKVRWLDYKGHKSLYIGRHFFGIVGEAHAPHRAKVYRYEGNIMIPGMVGPVAYGDTMAGVMRDIKNKAMAWLQGLCEEPPTLSDEPVTRTRRSR